MADCMESDSSGDDFMVESDHDDGEDFAFDDSDDEEAFVPKPKAVKKTKPGAAVAAAAKAKPAAKASGKKTATTAAASKTKKTTKTSVVASAVLSPRSDSALNVAPSSTSNDADSTLKPAASAAAAAKQPKSKKTVEEMYQKKTQLEHILLRPDTYIGSTLRDSAEMYVLNENNRIVNRSIMYTPGLFKIFDEIVVNACDNKQRNPESMTSLDIDIDADANLISVKNNGKGIPVVIHKEQGQYVPTLIFGTLLTGSNFDDDDKKTTGGRNGYGAKLANVFSTKFIVDCVDCEHGLHFTQVFRDNMSVAEKPIIKTLSAQEMKRGDSVKVSFSPDLARFGMTHLDHDTVSLFSKRAYDVAGTMSSSNGKKLVVSLNGNKLPIKSFKDYLGLFEGLSAPVAYEKNDRWEVGIAASVDATPHQVSFVNAICTSKGGGHVSYIADQVSGHLVALFKKKKKKLDVKPAQIKNHLTIFVNCLIECPTFDSQTKEFLTSKPKTFGSTCKLTEKFLKTVEKSDVVATIESFVSYKEKELLKRKGGTKKSKITGILKLDDANHAGTTRSADCTLIITEGDSAKSLAMSGLSVVGRDYYGVFPLRGKPMNVRDATTSQVTKNEEIKNLVEIMGLKFGVTYDESNIKTLRYGHLMIMADQDTDGSHIKGLVINFIHHFWPSLLDIPGFLQQFITPIVKVSRGKKSTSFFNLPEYHNWLESTGNNGKGYKIKYYKGLGTSTSAEAKEYFSNLDLHEVTFGKLSLDESYPSDYEQLENGNPRKKAVLGSDLIDMVFRKTRVSDRKDWLNALAKNTFMDYKKAAAEGDIKYSDFINKEYILFSTYDNQRSIPHVVDGLKPSQRKVLYACFKRNLKSEIKVAQLTGYVAEHSSYHHGEASLQQTIVNMAQNFVGSNNINLLTPSGQFGTRRMGGKDAASPRYIFTKLEVIARTIFHPDDDALLNYLNDDGSSIEPDFYVPVIPMVLVNGADGIGTGWSSGVNNYNPRDIVANLRHKIAGEPLQPMLPHYSGFVGTIVKQGAEKDGIKFQHKGIIERKDDNTLLISELPLKKWTQDYKQFLEDMLTGGEAKTPEIKDFKENHTDATVSFTITAEKSKIDEFESGKEGLYGKFKLTGSLSTSNMNLFDTQQRIAKYGTPEDILNEFFLVRLDFYIKRKKMLVEKLRHEQSMLANKARFVEEVCSGVLVVSNRKRKDILANLKSRGYESFKKDPKKKDGESDEDDDEDESTEESESEIAKGYDYLLNMKIMALTFEKAEALRAELAEKTAELAELEATEPCQLWLNDLHAIEVAMDERDVELQKLADKEMRAQQKNHKRQVQANKKKGAGRSKKKKDAWDSEMETSSDEEDELSDEDSVTVKKPAARGGKKQTSAKPAVTKAPGKISSALLESALALNPIPFAKAPSESEDEEFGEDEELTLAQRIQKKLVVSPPGKKKSAAKRPSPKMDDVEVLSDASEPKVMRVTQDLKRSRKPAARAPAFNDESDGDSEDAMDDSPEKPSKAKPRARAARPTKSKKAPVQNEESFDFDGSSSDSSVSMSGAPVVVARSRSARTQTKQKVNYANSDDDEDEESDFEFN